jgi:enoyl-CoA hydratase/carnithine racemase
MATASVEKASVLCTQDGSVAYVLLNRPDVRNAMNIELLSLLGETLVAGSETANVVVIRGAGGNFSAGGDRVEVAELRRQGPDGLRQLFALFRRTCEVIEQLPVPVIAAVEGHAVAGGFELMQACDIAVVSSSASIADHHANFGQLPAGGGTQRLPRLVGRQRALAHILTGDRLTAEEAVSWGLAYRSAPQDEFDSVVQEVAERLASKPREVLRRAKGLVRQGLALPLERGLDLELAAVLEHLGNPTDGPDADGQRKEGG